MKLSWEAEVVIWLVGSLIDFFITRAYWKANDCWDGPRDVFFAVVIGLLGGPLGAIIGLILMGPPWKPFIMFPKKTTNEKE